VRECGAWRAWESVPQGPGSQMSGVDTGSAAWAAAPGYVT